MRWLSLAAAAAAGLGAAVALSRPVPAREGCLSPAGQMRTHPGPARLGRPGHLFAVCFLVNKMRETARWPYGRAFSLCLHAHRFCNRLGLPVSAPLSLSPSAGVYDKLILLGPFRTEFMPSCLRTKARKLA